MTERFAAGFVRRIKDQYRVDVVFGIVGIPIVELAEEMKLQGIRFISCRNEQTASYAASAYGYLTGKPGVLLVVGGPGVIHALAGIYNSLMNRWPLVVIAGSLETSLVLKGGFQELDQVSLLGPYVKFCGRLNLENLDLVLFNAWNSAIQGAKGVTYVDFPGDLIERQIKRSELIKISYPSLLRSQPSSESISKVVEILQRSNDSKDSVLCVIGKGASDYSNELRSFIEAFGFPFLPTPLAKGVIPDSHRLNVSSARSLALKEAKVVLVFGARLNWILHFAEAPKWNPNAIFIQVDNHAETIGQNNFKGVEYSLYGDVGLTVQILHQELHRQSPKWYYHNLALPTNLQQAIKRNQDKLVLKEVPRKGELDYNLVYGKVKELVDDQNLMIVSEGANTMDIARISFSTDFPKRRLDAGTNATMGIGLGYAIAAKVANPKLDTLLIQGDSAFGFSAMDIETAVRFRLGLVILVMNNSGIYHGTEHNSGASNFDELPTTALSEKCRYDLVAKGLGGNGYLVTTLVGLQHALDAALRQSREHGVTSVLNIIITKGKETKIAFGWQHKPKL